MESKSIGGGIENNSGVDGEDVENVNTKAGSIDSSNRRSDISHKQMVFIVLALITGTFVATLDTTIINVALPVIVGDLGGLDQATWIVTAYLVTTTLATPIYGRVSDIFGRKLTYQFAAIIFVVASVLAGLSQTMWQLVLFRGIQGIGAGGLIALPMAIMGDLISPMERGRYLGYLSLSVVLSSVAGPFAGGLITDSLGWRWVFYVNVPTGLLSMAIVQRKLNIKFPKYARKIDWTGTVLLIASLGPILLALALAGEQLAWGSPITLLMIFGGIVGVIIFIWWERRAKEPLIPLQLFSNSIFSITNTCVFTLGVALFAAGLFVPIYLQVVKGLTATESGLLVVPLSIGLTLCSIGSGRLIAKTGKYKPFLPTGMAFMALGLFLLSTLDVGSSPALPSIYMFVIGCGIGASLPPGSLIVQNAVPHSEMGVATGTVNFMRSLGTSIGASVYGALYATLLRDKFSANISDEQLASLEDPEIITGNPEQIRSISDPQIVDEVLTSYSDTITTIFLAVVPIALIAMVVAFFIKQIPLRGKDWKGSDSESL